LHEATINGTAIVSPIGNAISFNARITDLQSPNRSTFAHGWLETTNLSKLPGLLRFWVRSRKSKIPLLCVGQLDGQASSGSMWQVLVWSICSTTQASKRLKRRHQCIPTASH